MHVGYGITQTYCYVKEEARLLLKDEASKKNYIVKVETHYGNNYQVT